MENYTITNHRPFTRRAAARSPRASEVLPTAARPTAAAEVLPTATAARSHAYPPRRASKAKLVDLPAELAGVKEIDVLDVSDDQTAYYSNMAGELRSVGFTKCAAYMTTMLCAIWNFGRVTNTGLMALLNLDPRDMNCTLNGKKSIFQGLCFDKHGDSKYHAIYNRVTFPDIYTMCNWVQQTIKDSGK